MTSEKAIGRNWFKIESLPNKLAHSRETEYKKNMNTKTVRLHFVALLLFTFVITSAKSWGQSVNAENIDPLLVNTKILPYDWNPGQGGSIELKLKLPAGYHAYEEKFRLTILEPDGFQMSTLKLKPVTEWYDIFSKKKRRGMKGDATLTAHLEAPSHFVKKHDKIIAELTYQACSDQFCLFPTTKKIEVPISTPSIQASNDGSAHLTNPLKDIPTEPVSGILNQFSDSYNLKKYLSTNIFAGFLFIFLAGIFTSFTPCIFPMIPITLAVLGNHSEEKTRMQNFITSVIYVLGIATTYSLLGLAAASGGSVFGASLGNPIVLTVVCVIFLAMALSMYGLYDLQLPAFIHNKLSNKKHGDGLSKVYLTGLFAGIVASPCVGPVLVAILTYVASTQNKLLGFLFLFTYALGFGLIFIALGLSNQFAKKLPRSGPWMIGFKFILGTLMLSAFYYYLNLLLPIRFFDFALGAGLIVLASTSGAFNSIKGQRPFKMIQKGLMQAVLFIGMIYIGVSVFDLRPYIQGRIMADSSINKIQMLEWKPYSEHLLKQAALEHKPVIIDFWAEWCAACHELEEHTFTDPRVRAFAGNYTLLKFDATRDSFELKNLKKKYNIQGLPTLIFINKNGMWIDALTLTQYEKAEAFLPRMEKGIK